MLLCLTPLLFAGLVHGQDNGEHTVTGTILDAEEGKPLPMATAILLSASDTSFLKGSTTDSSGRFTIRADEGKYLLRAQYVGYRPVLKPPFELNASSSPKDFGTITLKGTGDTLGEVTVEGERSQITMKEGKKIFNVGTDLSSSGASASDVLNNIPSVSMDLEGNLNLRGSDGVRILVNGKPSSMMGISSTEALRYFPANKIEKVEVITNPSAKYEAQGTAGIINIVLKESLNWGLNGTFTVEGGIPKDHGATVNMNYRKNWYNIRGSATLGMDRHPGGGWREQTYNYPDTTYSLRTDRDQSRGGLNYTLQLGSDLYFTPNDVLKVSGVYNVGDEENITDLSFYNYDGDRIHPDDLTEVSERYEVEEEKEGDHELNMSYEKTFGQEDHELTADLQFRNSIEIEDANLIETQGRPGEEKDTTTYQKSLNSTDVKGYMSKVDYTWPIGEEEKLEAGFRGEYRKITNEFEVEQRDSENESWETLDRFSNIFTYNEEIYGIYGMYNNKKGAFGYQGGIRFEFTGIDTRLRSEEFSDERSYYNIFPSLSLSYDLSDTTSLQLSYSRRLDRPYFRELNPYGSFSNDRNYRTGNPELDPEFTGAYDLGLMQYKQKSSIYIGAFYRRTVNEIENVDTLGDDGVTISKPYNLSSRDNLGIETRYSLDVNEWCNLSISGNFFRGSTSGSAAGEDLNNAAFTMDGRARVDIDVKDWFEFQVNGDYRAPEREGQDVEEAMYEINGGIRKELFDGKGNVAFSARDIFNTDVYRARTDGSNFTARREFQWRSGPFFSLSFTYQLKDRDAKRGQESVFGGSDER